MQDGWELKKGGRALAVPRNSHSPTGLRPPLAEDRGRDSKNDTQGWACDFGMACLLAAACEGEVGAVFGDVEEL
jgi:hypothetical protein